MWKYNIFCKLRSFVYLILSLSRVDIFPFTFFVSSIFLCFGLIFFWWLFDDTFHKNCLMSAWCNVSFKDYSTKILIWIKWNWNDTFLQLTKKQYEWVKENDYLSDPIKWKIFWRQIIKYLTIFAFSNFLVFGANKFESWKTSGLSFLW